MSKRRSQGRKVCSLTATLKLIPKVIKAIKRVAADLVANLHSSIGWKCKVDLSGERQPQVTYITGRDTYATVNSAITNLLGRGRQVCEVSGYDLFRLLRHKAADVDVDLVATIESLQDSCGCSTNSGVTGRVFLLDRSRIKQGFPGSVWDIVAGCEPDVGAVKGSLGTPRIVVPPNKR